MSFVIPVDAQGESAFTVITRGRERREGGRGREEEGKSSRP